jgi:hypothetical protein
LSRDEHHARPAADHINSVVISSICKRGLGLAPTHAPWWFKARWTARGVTIDPLGTRLGAGDAGKRAANRGIFVVLIPPVLGVPNVIRRCFSQLRTVADHSGRLDMVRFKEASTHSF